jgi:hypothetical protein
MRGNTWKRIVYTKLEKQLSFLQTVMEFVSKISLRSLRFYIQYCPRRFFIEDKETSGDEMIQKPFTRV